MQPLLVAQYLGGLASIFYYHIQLFSDNIQSGQQYPSCFTSGGYHGLTCSSSEGNLTIKPNSDIMSCYAGRTLVYSTDASNSLFFKGVRNPPVTDVVGFLKKVNGGFPPCLTNMTTACPSLYSTVQDCWNMAPVKNCFCGSIKTISCPRLCRTSEEPTEYIN